MNARELQNKINYLGQERSARKIVIEDKLATPEEVALMTDVEVYEKLLEEYEVVAVGNERITLVKHEDKEMYYKITKDLSR